jgi:hypothetical protein
MYQTKIAQASGRYAVDTSGASLYNIGNISLKPGDYVMTDGRCIYGRHRNQGLADIPVGGYVYPFYNPNCAPNQIFSESNIGSLCGMNGKGDINSFVSDIKCNGYSANVFVAGKNDVYFIKSVGEKYTAYNLNTGKSFVIYSDKINSFFLDACVDDDGNLLTAFRRKGDDGNGANGVLVFKNNSIIHDDKPMSNGRYNNELLYTTQFVHLRNNGTYVGVFCYYDYYEESDADRGEKNVEDIEKDINISEVIFDDKDPLKFYIIQTWKNAKLDMFKELSNTKCCITTSSDISHFRAILYNSETKDKTEILHIISTHEQSDYFIENFLVPVEKHKYPDGDPRKHNDESCYTGNEKYSVEFANDADKYYHKSNTVYSVKSNDFSISIGENEDHVLNFDKFAMNDKRYIPSIPNTGYGEMGFMMPEYTSNISIYGLEKNIGKSRIVDVKNMPDGSYLILTSDGVYTSDGSNAKLLCEDFKSWCNNFRLNSVPSRILSQANSIIGGIE